MLWRRSSYLQLLAKRESGLILNPRHVTGATSKLTRRISLNLEELLASRSRIRILKALAVNGSLNISGIRKCTGLNYRSIVRALEVLKYMRVVGEVHLGRTRSFRIKVENEEASRIDALINSVESLNSASMENDEDDAFSPPETVTPLTRYKKSCQSA